MLPLVILLVAGARAALTGTTDITVHHYIQTGSQQHVACGMAGADMDLTRVTAVNGLVKETQCGACLKVTSGLPGTKPQYVMAVDIVQVGLDLNEQTFRKLYNTDTGRFTGKWRLAHPKHCRGIVTGGPFHLPGTKLMPEPKKNKPTEPKRKHRSKHRRKRKRKRRRKSRLARRSVSSSPLAAVDDHTHR